MSVLFESTIIKSMKLANRFVRSATWEGLAASDGFVTPGLIAVSTRLAEGGLGLIISGHAYVSREGQATPFQLGVYTDEQVPGLSQLTDSVHALDGKVALQLAHAGAQASSSLSRLQPMGPSSSGCDKGKACREMTHEDINAVVKAFGEAARRAKSAGFDAVQVHGAHGYLVSQFFSPYFNKRGDEYGGSAINRARIAVEILKSIRDAVGAYFPVFIKMNAQDFLSGGLSEEDMFHIAAVLEKEGYDAMEMSGGTGLSGDNMPSRPGKPGSGETEAYYEASARSCKDRISMPLMLVGGIRTFETAERLVTEGVADYIALCRPLIREPGLVNRWKSGDKSGALCVSDNGCFRPGFRGKGVYCVVDARSTESTSKD